MAVGETLKVTIEYAYLAKEKNVFISDGMGIVSTSIEDIFEKIGELNNPGMVETDKCILSIIERIQDKK